MTMADETISGAEFGRFRVDLSARLDRQDRAIDDGFEGVHKRQDDANGRTAKNSAAIIRVEEKIARLEPIEHHVLAIQSHGCAVFEQHRAMMTPAEIIEEDRPKWPRRRQVIAGGGLVAAGAVVWPAIREVAHLFGELLKQLGAH
jgi:hypothetical protein